MRFFKVLSITLVLIGMTLVLKAQTEKGKFFLGTQTMLGFDNETISGKSGGVKTKFKTERSFSFSPKIGYFIKKDLVLGIATPVIIGMEKIPDDSQFNYVSISATPFVRYFFGKDKFKLMHMQMEDLVVLEQKIDPLVILL